jgi:hypothetical protein
MQFIHSYLTWGFLLPLVPLLIHLINMMRHQRVQWAAMDFLLASYKKSRRWVWLRQFILLALRMIAMILLVAMLARLVTDRQRLLIFGQSVTHHYVLLDDSYSMADSGAGTSAFDNAYRIIRTLVTEAAQEGGRHKLTLVRFSQADGPSGRMAADFEGEPIDNRIDLLLEQRRREIEVTDLAVGPAAALDSVIRLLDQQRGETNQVYLLSDFRAREWESPAELKSRLVKIEQGGRAETSLIRCVAAEHANLGIVSLAPAEDIRAAGVPLYMVVKVKNQGARPATKVQLRVRTLLYDTAAATTAEPGKEKPQIDELPVVLIEEIKPGETVEQRVQVYFPITGEHTVEAMLPEDAVSSDNRRSCTVDFPNDLPVLIVDGSADQRESFFLSSIFQPGGRVKTGIRVTTQPASYLRDASDTELAKFDSIYLLDVERLEARAASRLEEFARRGGGVCFFVGKNVNFDAYNRVLHRDGAGIFPTPLGEVFELDARTEETPPDLEVSPHPVFGVFLAERSSFLQQVTIRQHARAPQGYVSPPDLGVSAPVKLRNGDPLVLERAFGKGRVVAFLSSLSPDWNDWAKNPSLVVICLRLQPHLAAAKHPYADRLVGEPLRVELDPGLYRPLVRFIAPDALAGVTREVEKTAAKPSEQELNLATSLSGLGDSGVVETAVAGSYTAWLQTQRGLQEVRRYSLNVEPEEGQMAMPSASDMTLRLAGLRARFTSFDNLSGDAFVQKGVDLSLAAMIALILCLLLEQLAAYWASYHPPQRSGGGISAWPTAGGNPS